MTRYAATRRGFLAGSASLAVAPMFVPGNTFSADAPSKKITLGCIGVGTHGFGVNLKSFLQEQDARVIAVCDAFADRTERARAAVDKHYKGKSCRAYADFRDLLADDTIDAVVISTPDHWHVPMAMMGLAAGKHVFCEKPTLTIAEGRGLVKEVKKRGLVFQIGLEDRSLIHYHKLAEIVRNGAIGKLERMYVRLPAGNNYVKEDPVDVPKGFDYDMWLGPAPVKPYSPTRVTPQGWRNIRDYSGGKFTDWGSHLMDTAQVCNFAEKTTPVEVEGQGEVPEDALTDVPVNYHLRYVYANGVEMIVDSRNTSKSLGKNAGIRCEGSEGWVEVDGWRGEFSAHDKAILHIDYDPQETKLWPRPEREHRCFLDAITKGAAPSYTAEDLQRLSSMMHIGNISMELGRKLKWNPDRETFPDDPEANALRSREARKDWGRS